MYVCMYVCVYVYMHLYVVYIPHIGSTITAMAGEYVGPITFFGFRYTSYIHTYSGYDIVCHSIYTYTYIQTYIHTYMQQSQ